MEGFVNHPWQILYISYQIAVFRNRHRDARNVRFLESVRTDQGCCNVTGYHNEWNGIHISCCDTGHKVRCPGPEVAMHTPTLPLARA